MNITRRPAIISERSVKRRRRKRVWLFTAVLLALSFLVSGLLWLTNADFLLIKNVEIEGAGETLEKDILIFVDGELNKNFLWIFPKRNTVLFSGNYVEEKIYDKYTRVKNVEVKRDGISDIEIIIEERQPDALWCDGDIVHVGNCYFVDEYGYIFRKAPFFSDHVYYELYGGPLTLTESEELYLAELYYASSSVEHSTTTGVVVVATQSTQNAQEDISVSRQDFLGSHYLPEETFLLTILFIRALEQKGIPTYALVVYDKNHFELSLGEGGVLKFSPQQDLVKAIHDFTIAYDKKFKEDTSVTPADLEYVDTRFTNKVIFKFVQ